MTLRLSDISKSFGNKQALSRLSITVQPGKPFGLLGRNGAGKTTALRIIAGLFEPDSGSVTVDGEAIRRDRVRIGYLPEERGLYRTMRVAEQLRYFARLRGKTGREASEVADAWLHRFSLESAANAKLQTLSKGNQQRIQLAVALIDDPDIALLDEPFSGLDPVGASELRAVLEEYAARGKTVVFSSHQMDAVESFCEDIAIINMGRSVLSGSLAEIKSRSACDRIRVAFAPGSDYARSAEIASQFGEASPTRDGFTVTLREPTERRALMMSLTSSGDDVVA
ncbi:MAG: ATP-binding cassette domain-containing protein, partial [Clostridia bacterium]|nr:ATP-binding cassette domain-containing protein [Clostridia bacterium]